MLFRTLKPQQKFHINITAIAKILHIPRHLILRLERWAYVIFIHRQDCEGQFISYRRLQNWQNAVACKIQSCCDCEQLKKLWLAILQDLKKYHKQYSQAKKSFIRKVWIERRNIILSI